MSAMFVLEALQARHGDALLLHWGDDSAPRLAVIDGGPSGVYARALRPRLEQIRASRGGAGALALDLVMVSHIDDDHIRGILDLTRELVEAQERQRPGGYRIGTLWHNSFEDVAGQAAPTVLAGLPDAVTAAAGEPSVPEGLPLERHAAAVVASVRQGRALRDDARALGIPVNRPFPDLVKLGGGAPDPVDMGAGATLRVVGPSQAQLDALQREWRSKAVVSEADPAVLAAFVDQGVFNLSSIVVVVEAAGRRMLLTGDARGDHILEGLEQSGLVRVGGSVHFELFKLPHHGSDRNVESVLFERVTADHYVVSGDGGHGNPEVETLSMLTASRRDDDFTISLTNRQMRGGVGEAVAAFFERERGSGRRYRVSYRDDSQLGVSVDLLRVG